MFLPDFDHKLRQGFPQMTVEDTEKETTQTNARISPKKSVKSFLHHFREKNDSPISELSPILLDCRKVPSKRMQPICPNMPFVFAKQQNFLNRIINSQIIRENAKSLVSISLWGRKRFQRKQGALRKRELYKHIPATPSLTLLVSWQVPPNRYFFGTIESQISSKVALLLSIQVAFWKSNRLHCMTWNHFEFREIHTDNICKSL